MRLFCVEILKLAFAPGAPVNSLGMVQFLKPKSFGAYWAPSFYEWLVASGNGEYVQPRRLDARFWCNDTTACA
jgi:hypothetical protein